MPKYKHRKYWAKWNNKLERFDITIDLADIGHISKRAYATGYLSPKVIKKWRKRGKKSMEKGSCQSTCQWLPARIFKSSYLTEKSFWWRCRKCHCITKWIWEDEISEPLLNAYREHTRNKETYERPAFLDRLFEHIEAAKELE